MITRIFTVALELCLALVASASVIKRYQDYPLQVCPINAVCSEIYRVPSQEMTSSYLNFVTCKCSSGMYCPTEPGPQTLSAEANRWYGLCTPADALPPCQGDDEAEEVRVNAADFNGQTYKRIHCTCPKHLDAEMSNGSPAAKLAAVTSNSREAKTIYHLMCNDDYMTKRGRYGGETGGRSRSRFYFYK